MILWQILVTSLIFLFLTLVFFIIFGSFYSFLLILKIVSDFKKIAKKFITSFEPFSDFSMVLFFISWLIWT